MTYPSGPEAGRPVRISFPTPETLFIDGLSVADADLVETVKEWGRTHPRGRDAALEELPEFVAWLLSLGAKTYTAGRVSASVGLMTAAASDAGKTITSSVSEVSEQVAQASGAIRDAVTSEMDRLVGRMAEVFDGDDSPAALAIKGSLRSTATSMATELSGRLEAAVAASVRSGLDGIRGEVRSVGEVVSHVKDHLATSSAARDAAAAVTGKSALKGGDFEDTMNDVMDALAAEASREYLATGTQQGQAVGTGSSLKGDGVWIHDGTRIALEFHNGMSRSKHGDTHQQGWSVYLAEAMKNRDATAALGVVAGVNQNKGRSIRGLGTNMAVIACDPDDPSDIDRLRFMMVVMEMVARTHEGRSAAAGDVLTKTDILSSSVLAVRRCLDEFKDGLGTIADLERQASKTESSATQLRQTAFGLRARLSGTIGRALAETGSQMDLLGLTVAAVEPECPDEEDSYLSPDGGLDPEEEAMR